MGATVRDDGINFAVFSRHALRIELCVFDAHGEQELERLPLHGPYDGVFHGFMPGAKAGLVYGLRAYGPYEPERGHRFNPHKLLLDPCAREIVGQFNWRPEHHGYPLGHPHGAFAFDTTDNAKTALKARVADRHHYDRSNAPRTEIGKLVLYEVHVKGFSQQHPGIPENLRGTYGALAHSASIAHFKSLGVTTLSLLPVHYALDEPGLAERGLVNYWGYNTLGFFCPSPRLSTQPKDPTAAAREFRAMVQTLHANGLEVVLDVVYNHSAEGNEMGPTLSWRGLDNANWYRLLSDDRSRCENLTGCGNTLNAAHPQVTQFILDSLRFWVQDMGVDGFRFDLAPVLGRTHHGFDPQAAFFTALRQDPVLNTVHLIAEPWDAAHDGYQVGRFPGRFLEWNDKFRDTVRGYWLQAHLGRHLVDRGEFARRFTGSSDLFHHGQRQPTASVNFITAHDGFSLIDALSYAHKHNHANGEDNRDGRDGELSHNFGAEGPSTDPAVNAMRQRVRRALAATLLLAQGTPMLCAGDEFGNTQHGNNNAYCQDNPTGWLNWEQRDTEFEAFVCNVLQLRRADALLRHTDWFAGHFEPGGPPSLQWRKPSGEPMQTHDWHDRYAAVLGCQITARQANNHGVTTPPNSILIVFNPEPQASLFELCGSFVVVLDSSLELATHTLCTSQLHVPASALVVLRQV
jgi:glycogen operon protein